MRQLQILQAVPKLLCSGSQIGFPPRAEVVLSLYHRWGRPGTAVHEQSLCLAMASHSLVMDVCLSRAAFAS